MAYQLSRVKSKEFKYLYGDVKQSDGTYKRYWSDTPKKEILKEVREAAQKRTVYTRGPKAGQEIPKTEKGYASVEGKARVIGPNLFEMDPLVNDPQKQKRYFGRIGRRATRKDPATGKMFRKNINYETDVFTDQAKAESALEDLQKKYPKIIGGEESGVEQLRKHLQELPEGSTINRRELQYKYFPDTEWGPSRIGKVLGEFENQNFKIVGTGPILRTGETRIRLNQKERIAINQRFSKEYGGLKGKRLYNAMAAEGETEKARMVIQEVRRGSYFGTGSGSGAKDAVIRQLAKLKKLPWIRRWFKEGDFTRQSVRDASSKIAQKIRTNKPLPRGQTWLSIGARRIADLARALTGDTEYIKIKTEDKGVLKGVQRVVDTTKESIFQDFGTPFKREMYNKNVARQLGYTPGFITSTKQFITQKLRREHHVDMVKNIASAAKAGTGGYSGFWQAIREDINRPMKSKVDLGMEEAEFKLRNVGDNSKVYTSPDGVTETREQIRDTYNRKVKSFLSEANKDVKPGEPVVRALELTLDVPPSESIQRYGEMTDIMKKNVDNAWTRDKYGFKVPKDLLFPEEMKAAVKDPNILKKIWKMGPKSARVLGISALIGGGAYVTARSLEGLSKLLDNPLYAAMPDQVQLQTAGLTGGTTIPKVDLVPRTVVDEQVTEVAEAPITDEMTYNAIEGKFVKPDGDPETQEGVLNWIADHPIYSGLAAIPVGMGAGLGAEAMKADNVAKFFTSMKFMLPPAYAAEKLYQYKEGQDLGEMFTNPLDAVWAMALDTPKSAAGKMDYYRKMAMKHKGITSAEAIKSQQLGLKPSTWKNIGKATMAPRSLGTSLVFPFAGPKAGAGLGMKVFRGAARLAPLGPIPMALTAGYMAWDKYKFNKSIAEKIDALRAQGMVNEEDAQSMQTIYKQGWLGTTAIGAKLLGSEELMLDGELADIDRQKEVLAEMKAFYEGREEKGTRLRTGERQEDFFSWFSGGGRVGLAEGGNKKPFGGFMTRRSFLKWLVGSIAAGTAALTGRGLKQAAKTVTTTAGKKIPAHFVGVEGMPEWFFRAVQKIKASGKLIEMADKDYVGGDIYEMMLPVKVKRSLSGRPGHDEIVTVNKKVTLEENPLSGEIEMHWDVEDFDGTMKRQINFKPGQSGFQKFGVDDPEAAAQGMTELQRVKVEEPEFTYGNPDQSNPYREDFEYRDIFTEGDEVVEGLANFAGVKPAVTKETQALEKEAQKKLYKDIEGEEAIIPEPEHAGVDHLGNVYGEEEYLEIIGGNIPDHLKKKAEGGIIETGNIARRPGAVPPLSGPNPQGSGIVGLFSNPKQVNVGS